MPHLISLIVYGISLVKKTIAENPEEETKECSLRESTPTLATLFPLALNTHHVAEPGFATSLPDAPSSLLHLGRVLHVENVGIITPEKEQAAKLIVDGLQRR